jgi:hypothetical protein
MKKRLFVAAIMVLAMTPILFAQIRFEIGANAPIKVGYISNLQTQSASFVDAISQVGIIPIPNLSLFLQADLSVIKLGVGLRAQSVLIFSAAYPLIQAELALGALAIDASIGGYYFGYYGLGGIYGIQNLGILLPDLSAWFGFGKSRTFRIGGGVIGAIPTSFDLSSVPFVAYGGLKVVL